MVVGAAVLTMMVGCRSSDSDKDEATTTRSAAPARNNSPSAPAVPKDARQVHPSNVGEKAPVAVLRRPDGEQVELATLYKQKPTVLIFYRGGWCPYCNTHLGQIATAEPELLKMGYQVLAISPDRPEELAKTVDKQNLTYLLLSDSDAVLARAFGLVFHVDDATVEKYRGLGIDLERSSGRNHHLLPVPAVYILDTTGTIRFAHWNPDYKKRLEPEALLKAARGILPASKTSAEQGG
jgi:peroxiredoxin